MIEHEGLSGRRSTSRMGKIRAGKKSKNAKGKEYPEKLDHFRFDPDDENILPVLHKLYGERSTRLPVMFVAGDREAIFPQYLKKYGKSGLLCKGTGGRDENDNPKPVFMRVTAVNEETGEVTVSDDYPCDPENCEDYKSGRCKRLASLCGFILCDYPALRTWQIDTTSKISIERLNSRLDDLETLAASIKPGHGVAGIPLILSLNPVQVKPKGAKRKQTVYVYDLDLDTVRLMKRGPMLSWIGKLAQTGQVTMQPADETETPDGMFSRSQVEGADLVAERIEMSEGEAAASEDETDPVLANLPNDIAEGMRAIGLTVKQVRRLVLRYLEPGESTVTGKQRRLLFKYLNGLADLKANGDEASFQANIAGLDSEAGDVDDAERVEDENEAEVSETEEPASDPLQESADALGLGDI